MGDVLGRRRMQFYWDLVKVHITLNEGRLARYVDEENLTRSLAWILVKARLILQACLGERCRTPLKGGLLGLCSADMKITSLE